MTTSKIKAIRLIVPALLTGATISLALEPMKNEMRVQKNGKMMKIGDFSTKFLNSSVDVRSR